MNKILRNAILSLCLTSCLAMGMDGDGDGSAVSAPATPCVVMPSSTVVAPIKVTDVGPLWRLIGYKKKFFNPLTGAEEEATFDAASAALGAACGVTYATRVELEKREGDLRGANAQLLASVKEISDLRALLAAANATKEEQARGLQDLAARLAEGQAMCVMERDRAQQAQSAAERISSDCRQALALAAQREEGLARRSTDAERTAEVRLAELGQIRDTHSRTLEELAGIRAAADVNHRLVEMMREEAGVMERKIGSLIERVLQFQRQLRVVVTSDHPVEDLDSARKFVVREYEKERASLERELEVQRGTLDQAQSERQRLESQRGQDAPPPNLEELIKEAAKRIERLQVDVREKTQHLSTLTAEKAQIEEEIEALESKSVRDFIEKITSGGLQGLTPFKQFSELARRGHNHKWSHGEGLTKGSKWLGEELVSQMTRDPALQLLTDGGISREMAEWFLSVDAQKAITDHGMGTSVGTKAMDEANWATLKARFGVV